MRAAVNRTGGWYPTTRLDWYLLHANNRRLLFFYSVSPMPWVTKGLAKNHKICNTSHWTRYGTDDFLGSVKQSRGRALSIPPKAHQPWSGWMTGADQHLFVSMKIQIANLTENRIARNSGCELECQTRPCWYTKIGAKKKRAFFSWRGVFSLDLPFNGWPPFILEAVLRRLWIESVSWALVIGMGRVSIDWMVLLSK